jgi:tetratricopeptide (TPR) repeat protein
MRNGNIYAKVNVKLLFILILVVAAIGSSLLAARQIRRNILSKKSLEAGEAAFEEKDWPVAYENFKEYLGRNPDDIEIIKKFAQARLSIRPLDGIAISEAISAYRRVMQLSPVDEVAFDRLVALYSSIENFEELAYIARTRLEHIPDDKKAPLCLADALINLNRKEAAREVLLKFMEELDAHAEKYDEYARACVKMSKIVSSEDSPEAVTKALEWLNRAVEYAPESVDALANRGRFYRINADIPGMRASDRLAAARKDFEAADNLAPDEPHMRIFLGSEWMALGELDKADAEIKAVDSLAQEKLQEYFLDIRGWTVVRYLLASEVAAKRGAVMEAASLADETLTVLTESRHRVQVLPSAIGYYVAAGEVSQARSCLDEYLDALHTLDETQEYKSRLAYLQALVAKAEGKPYVVIDMLQPVAVDNASPQLWRLLAEAYGRTDQTRRAVDALIKYLNFYPRDPEMILHLVEEYRNLKDWQSTFKMARYAESLNPDDVMVKLLRIEAEVHLALEQSEKIDTAKLEELLTELNELRREHPKQVNIRELQAIIAIHLGQPDKAEEQLKLAIEECNEPLSAEMQLVNYYYRNDRMEEAVGVCETACKRHLDIAEPWICLSELYVADKDYDLARNCLKQGLDTVTEKQQKRSLSIRLAMLELLHGQRAAGIDILKELAAQDEQEIQARVMLLGVREIQEDSSTAEKLVGELRQAEGQTGLRWRLQQASLLLSLADWRSKQRDIEELLQYCISADPAWSAPVLLLVDMYERLGDYRRVEDICRQALSMNPSAVDIADRLLLLLEGQGRFEEAESVLQQVDMNRRVANAWNIRMAIRMGDFSRAINELKLRISNDKNDVVSRIQLARLVYQQTRDSKQALEYLKDVEEISSGPSLVVTGIKASILREDGQIEEAMRIIDNYVADANDFNAYWMRALYLSMEGEFVRAEQDYKKLTTFTQMGTKGYELLSNFYINNKQFEKAVAILEEGLNAFPDDLALERRLMKLLLQKGPVQDRARALEILTKLEEQLPKDPELMRIRALQLLEDSTPQSQETAREMLEDVIKIEPTAIDAHLMLIRIAMQQREYESARNYAIQALGSNPNNLALMSARSRIELAIGNTQMAVELARLVIQREPDNTEARKVFVDAALASRDRGLLKEARMLVESAIDSDSENEDLLISRANILSALELYQTAIPELVAYYQTEEGGRSVPVIVTLTDLYRLTGDMEKAGKMIERAEELEPDNQAVVHARFLLLNAQNRYEELMQISSAYLSAKQQNPELLLEAASILAASDSTKLKEEALKLFEHVVSISPDLMNARLGWASTIYQMGDIERAKNMYQELLAQYPNDIRILNDLAWILQEHNQQYDEALELANRGLELAPNDLHLLDTRGAILSKMENSLGDAKKDFEKLVELIPSNSREKARALLKLGRICVKLDDITQAKQHLKQALDLDRKLDVFTPAEREEIAGITR